MITLCDGTKVSSMEYNTALTLAARKRGVSDGVFMDVTDWKEREEIVAAYLREKRRTAEQKRQKCAGCIHQVRLLNNPNQLICNFSASGHVRRRDEAGNCLEFTPDERCGTSRQQRTGGPMRQRLMSGNFAQKTIPEIAAELGKSSDRVRNMIAMIEKDTGYTVPYKREQAEAEESAKPPNPYREGTLIWRLMAEDWSGKTIAEIAEELGQNCGAIRQMIYKIKEDTGYRVPKLDERGLRRGKGKKC